MSTPLAGLVVALDPVPFDDLIGVVEVLVQEGVGSFAFHIETPELATWVGIYGSRARIGVHRVSTSAQAIRAIQEGASFVLADVAKADIIAAAEEAALYVSAMTPTEIRAAAELPVSGVQVMPADVLGPSYADNMFDLGLIDRCLPRGGLGAYAAGRWFSAGAKAVVVDSQLLGDALTGGDLGALRERCESFTHIQP